MITERHRKDNSALIRVIREKIPRAIVVLLPEGELESVFPILGDGHNTLTKDRLVIFVAKDLDGAVREILLNDLVVMAILTGRNTVANDRMGVPRDDRIKRLVFIGGNGHIRRRMHFLVAGRLHQHLETLMYADELSGAGYVAVTAYKHGLGVAG